jgi:hypothetical protein
MELDNKNINMIADRLNLTISDARKVMFGRDKKWDLEKMEYLRETNAELRNIINSGIETIEIIARKYRTDK